MILFLYGLIDDKSKILVPGKWMAANSLFILCLICEPMQYVLELKVF